MTNPLGTFKNNQLFPEKIAIDMEKKNIDLRLTRNILDKYNAGQYDHIEPVVVSEIPEIDGQNIIDLTGDLSFTFELDDVQKNIDHLNLNINLKSIGITIGSQIIFNADSLLNLGTLLYPVLSYGILNGGSASSYFDQKKNQSFNEVLYKLCEDQFLTLEKLAKDKAKGLAPAFINENGVPGPSFIELKMRSLLIETLRYQKTTGSHQDDLLPLFQMTSINNNDQIYSAYEDYQDSIYLKSLISATGVDVTRALTGIQPMLAAFTHSKMGRPKAVFTNAFGEPDSVLPMPGGHGQNFEILQDVYRHLRDSGKKFIYLGNVDNLGYTVNPIALALLALTKRPAGFEFSFRTVVDIKGGILIKDQYHRLNCADIGPAISPEEVLSAEKSGKNILFNCATGLFNLEYLVTNLEQIINNLPVRFSDQDKDAGLYSQAEQITWEIIGMLENPLIFAVDKYDRFLAAKLVLENLMASGVALDNPNYPTSPDPKNNLKSIATKLHHGLETKLQTVYGLKKVNQEWIPKSVKELEQDFE